MISVTDAVRDLETGEIYARAEPVDGIEEVEIVRAKMLSSTRAMVSRVSKETGQTYRVTSTANFAFDSAVVSVLVLRVE